MKLKHLEFLDISKSNDLYTYTYGLFGKTYFRKKFYKFLLIADKPQWWWSEIQKQMIESNNLFEDVLHKGAVDIKIGKIMCKPFSEEDIEKYGVDISHWHNFFLEKAINDQKILSDEYSQTHGQPDLSKYSILAD